MAMILTYTDNARYSSGMGQFLQKIPTKKPMEILGGGCGRVMPHPPALQPAWRLPLRSLLGAELGAMSRHQRANGRMRARCGIPSSHPAARFAVFRYPPHYRHRDA